jgi:hypothetical protein
LWGIIAEFGLKIMGLEGSRRYSAGRKAAASRRTPNASIPKERLLQWEWFVQKKKSGKVLEGVVPTRIV